MTRLDRTATVAEIVAEHAGTVRVFERHDIDFFSPRGELTVFAACRERDLDPEEVYTQLEAAIAAAGARGQGDDPRRLADAALVAHIVERHHRYARRALPYIVPLLAKVASFEGKRNRKLNALCDAGHELAATLEAHLDEEERDLFPAVLTSCAGYRLAAQKLEELDREHRDLAELLERSRALADDYVAPAQSTARYRALMEELEALDDDVKRHMHLETHVLLPRLRAPVREVH